jgi:beta-ribofuranosylaminobenzene 5'-phosphate synthase
MWHIVSWYKFSKSPLTRKQKNGELDLLRSASMPVPEGITVTIPARLHLGFLDLNGGLGRRFGSIGLAISGLRTTIAVRRARKNHVTGPERERVMRHMEQMTQRLALGDSHIADVLDAVPAHAGLGSGTQLALAVAAGVRRLHGLPLDIEGDALYLGRGARSGVGIGLFHRGGLLVDGGCANTAAPAPIVSRIRFPDRWRIIVVLDPARRGIHGAEEVTAFGKLPPFPEDDAARLCRLVIMKMLPAAAEEDIVSFGAAIKDIQECLGDYFAAAQGGSPFTSPDVAAVLAALDREGAYGIGQSSWGPTGFAFSAAPAEADRLARIAQQHPRGRGLDIRVCAGFNHGAEIAESVGASAE